MSISCSYTRARIIKLYNILPNFPRELTDYYYYCSMYISSYENHHGQSRKIQNRVLHNISKSSYFQDAEPRDRFFFFFSIGLTDNFAVKIKISSWPISVILSGHR